MRHREIGVDIKPGDRTITVGPFQTVAPARRGVAASAPLVRTSKGVAVHAGPSAVDHDSCLEVTVLKGRGTEVKTFAERGHAHPPKVKRVR